MTLATVQYFTHDGLQLAYRDSAPDDSTRPVVLLLHGFPDSSRMWAQQMAALHARGFRAVAPDTRGCGDSDVSQRRRDYRAPVVAADFVALLDHLGAERADIVGHDWGAVLAWVMAGHWPERVRRLVALSVGHPDAYAAGGWAQKKASWYMGLFALGGVAERALLGRGRFSLERVLPDHPDATEVRHRLARPDRTTAALRIYRANLWALLTGSQPPVAADTLGVWSDGDRYLVEAQMRASADFVRGSWRYERLPGGHWIPLTQGEALNTLLAEHLGEAATTP